MLKCVIVTSMEKQFHLYALGNAIMDLQLKVDDRALSVLKLQKGGMRLVDLVEQRKLLDYCRSQIVYHTSGGSAANTVITLAQLGGTASYCCLVGDDDFGRFYLNEMENLGIHLHNPALRGHPTGTSVILVTPDAERTMNTHLGVSELLGPEHVSEEVLANSQWLYIEGYKFTSEAGRAAIEKALAIAKSSGVKVAVTVSDAFIVDIFGEALRSAIAMSDLVFANFEEAKRFTDKQNELEIFESLKKAAPNVVMTMGKNGARVHYKQQDFMISPYPVDAVDATGAGDVFAGAFLASIARNLDGEKAGKVACYLASRVVSQLGARLKGDVKEVVRSADIAPGVF